MELRADRRLLPLLLRRTINVLEGLLEFERPTGGTPQCREARRSGEEFLLERHLSRPSELVLEILPETHKGAFTKEDGEKVLDAKGKRIV
ncbi:hypothetical protein FHX03_004115 [Rhizobium sp. BK456]|nr:hypothetical protein [Rhizobium sp. BK456]